jgi:hypothetical protein
MPKYGRGLNREIVGAVNQGILTEPLTAAKVRQYAESRGWNSPDAYIDVALSNGASSEHSQTYRKYFDALGGGKYTVKRQYKGAKWF